MEPFVKSGVGAPGSSGGYWGGEGISGGDDGVGDDGDGGGDNGGGVDGGGGNGQGLDGGSGGLGGDCANSSQYLHHAPVAQFDGAAMLHWSPRT